MAYTWPYASYMVDESGDMGHMADCGDLTNSEEIQYNRTK